MIFFDIRHAPCVVFLLALATALAASASPAASTSHDSAPAPLDTATLAGSLKVGDLVFIRVAARPFREVAAATGSWTNHVGVVVATRGEAPLIAESTFPLSRTTTLSSFVARSEGARVAVSRLAGGLSPEQEDRVRAAAERREGVLYDTGFDIGSPRQFCSRFVREVLLEATGAAVGEVENFATLFARQPQADLGFWKLWYFGRIPWARETVTPASLLQSPALQAVFDSAVGPGQAR